MPPPRAPLCLIFLSGSRPPPSNLLQGVHSGPLSVRDFFFGGVTTPPQLLAVAVYWTPSFGEARHRTLWFCGAPPGPRLFGVFSPDLFFWGGFTLNPIMRENFILVGGSALDPDMFDISFAAGAAPRTPLCLRNLFFRGAPTPKGAASRTPSCSINF